MKLSRRTLVPFLDITLMMTAVMAMLVHAGENREAAAAAIADSFTPDAQRRTQQSFKVAAFFQPGEARLSLSARTALDRMSDLPGSTRITISVPVIDARDNARLDAWELSAARTASIMRYLTQQGLAPAQFDPRLQRRSRHDDNHSGEPMVSIIATRNAISDTTADASTS